MKTVILDEQQTNLAELLQAARSEPVLLVEPMGGEFVLAVADDFEAEAETLRNSPAFQEFLEHRSRPMRTRPFSEYVRELDEELKRQALTHEPAAT